MITLPGLANHLWQSTAFMGIAALLAFALRRHHARARCWLWTAASLKFLAPFSMLMAIGERIEWRSAPLAVRAAISAALVDVGAPFDPGAAGLQPARPSSAAFSWLWLLAALWAIGFGFVLLRWLARWRTVAAVVRSASRITAGREREAFDHACAAAGTGGSIPLASSQSSIEPGVFGILRPVLVLPEGIGSRLSASQLEAIFAHELAHVRHRDNLSALVHMVVQAIFWFHPLVWWLGARLVDERERACDEEVLRLGGDSQSYAEGILKACRFYLQSPVACVSGVTGGALKARIQRIMRRQFTERLGPRGKLLLGAAAFCAVAAPVFVGVTNVPVAGAQTHATGETFDVVSINPAARGQRGMGFVTSDPGRFHAINVTLADCILTAYGIQAFQLVAANLPPERYEIVATAPSHPSRILDARYEAMLQALLADRFHLKVHRDSKVMAVYALEIAKGGPKLKESKESGLSTRSTPGHVIVTGATMAEAAMYLTHRIQHPVVDVTGLKGLYDFTLDWEPGDGDANVEPPNPDQPQSAEPTYKPSLFKALEQQAGLKLASRKLPVGLVVVDSASKPSAN